MTGVSKGICHLKKHELEIKTGGNPSEIGATVRAYLPSGRFKNFLSLHAAQYQKNKQPNPKMGRRPK